MDKRWFSVMALGLLGQVAAAQQPSANPKIANHDLVAQSRQLMQWWPGLYDNHEQIVRQSGGGISPPANSPFHRLHSDVRKVDAPQLGDQVLALAQHRDNDPAHVTRRELAVVAIDPAAGVLRVRRFAVTDPRQFDDPASLRVETLKPMGAACDILFHYVGRQFEGAVADRKCATGQPGDAIVVGQDFVWEREQGRPHDWYQQSRAHPFTCNVFASEGKMAETRFLTTLHLHDQGGEADIAWPDGRTLTFTIHQRAFSTPTDREYPIFRIHDKGSPVPIAYGYAVDGARRFGLNLGWFYVRCYDDRDMTPADMGEARK
ncbi:MAG: CpcT/CpeT family chromophore lyase [Sphingobium sp.]